MTTARTLTVKEFTGLISNVRLGAATGILNIPMDVISRLLIDAMPGTMISQSKQELDAAKADLERAALCGKRWGQTGPVKESKNDTFIPTTKEGFLCSNSMDLRKKPTRCSTWR